MYVCICVCIYEGGEEERAMSKNKEKQTKCACSLSQVKLGYMYERCGNKNEVICTERPLVRGDR